MERKNKREPGIRKTPLRRCVVCRRQSIKEDFLRAVLAKDGKVSLDESGKAQGRGAYVCKNSACMNKLVKQRGFNRSFKRDAGAEVYEGVSAYINGLFSLTGSAQEASKEKEPRVGSGYASLREPHPMEKEKQDKEKENSG